MRSHAMKTHGPAHAPARAGVTQSMQRRARRQSGIATFTAVMVLSLVMLSVMGLARYLAHQARYTRDEAADAQLRQLLLAGEWWTRANVSTVVDLNNPQHEPITIEVPLPQTLIEAGGSLHIDNLGSPKSPSLQVRITATLRDRQMTQLVSYPSPATSASASPGSGAITEVRLQSGLQIPRVSR